jgi:hypothetical protein
MKNEFREWFVIIVSRILHELFVPHGVIRNLSQPQGSVMQLSLCIFLKIFLCEGLTYRSRETNLREGCRGYLLKKKKKMLKRGFWSLNLLKKKWFRSFFFLFFWPLKKRKWYNLVPKVKFLILSLFIDSRYIIHSLSISL